MGSLFSSPSQPAQPDYGAAANQQIAGQQQLAGFNANLNRPNISSPTGSQTWSRDAQGNYTQTNQFSPEQEALYWPALFRQAQQGQAASNRLDTVQGQGEFNPQTGEWGKAPGSSASYQDAARAAALSRSNTDLDQQQAALDTRLANQGITAGSEAYNNAQTPIARQRVDAGNQATLTAASLGNTMYGQDLAGGQFANQTRQQQMAEALQRRQLPLNEYQQLNAGTGPTMPTFTPGSGSALPAAGVQPALQQYTDSQGRYNAASANQTQQQTAALQALSTYLASNPSWLSSLGG